MRTGREQALSVVEVIIAVLLLTAVVSSLALAVAGGNRLRGSARLQASLTSSGQRIQEDLSSDRRWMEKCDKPGSTCDLSKFVSAESLRLRDVADEADGAGARVEEAFAIPKDSDVDNDAAGNDLDGVTPDFYRIVVVIEPTKEVATRYMTTPKESQRRFVTTIDRNGERQEGSLVIEACKVINQADERMQIQGCRSGGRTHVDMRGCPQAARLGCKPAWSWLSAISKPSAATPPGPSPFLSMSRVSTKGMGIAVRDVNGGPVIKPTRFEDGLAIFEEIPAGEYRLQGVPLKAGAGTERWATKELPSHHDGVSASVVVDPGIKNRALVMFRHGRAGSINLFFQRKIRTYHLGGPYTSKQTHVAPKEKTDGYQGASAKEACKDITDLWGTGTNSSAGTEHWCSKTAPHGKNCMNVYISGTVWMHTTLADATHILVHDGLGYVSAVEINADMSDPGAMGDPVRHKVIKNALALRYCTFYAEYFTHTYYSTTTPKPPYQTVDGARHAVTYYTEPKPDYRHLDFDGNKASSPIPVCVTAKYGQCTTPAWPGVVPLSKGMVPGLNSDILVPGPDKADANVNDHFSGPPAPLSSGAIWVKTNGKMVTPTGTYNGEKVKIVGMGECYWTSVRFGGKVEGPCDPCQPMWTKSKSYSGCSILTRTDWCRPAWESVQQWDWTGGGHDYGAPFFYSIQKHCGKIKYSPPWRCTTWVPKTGKGSTCSPQPSGGGGPQKVPATKHKSDKSSGFGLQGGVNMGGGLS